MAKHSFNYRDKTYLIITRNKKYEPFYREKLSVILFEKYGKHIIADKVNEALEISLNFELEEMEKLLAEIKDHTFFFFVHNLHEMSAELSYFNQREYEIPVDRDYFAIYRRILKMILQQACLGNVLEAKAVDKSWLDNSIELIEKLIYLGEGIIGKVNAIAEQKMIGGSIEITFENGLVTFGNTKPWRGFISTFHNDFPEQHNGSVVDSKLQEMFDAEMNEEFGLDLKSIASLIHHVQENLYNQDPPSFLTVAELTDIFNNHSESPHINNFISGLILNKQNVAPLKSGVLSAYSGNRIIHKPLILIHIDDVPCILTGFYVFYESINTFFQNNITHGKLPEEWKSIPFIQKLKDQFRKRHKDILEDPVENLLKDFSLPYKRNVTTLQSWDWSNNVSINKHPGEIDFIFIKDNIIFLADCKNLTKRYEMQGYLQDVSKFKPYHKKMEEKISYLNNNRKLLTEHIQVMMDDKKFDSSSFPIIGIFIINTPTLYMIDGMHKIYSLYNFGNLLAGSDYLSGSVIVDDENFAMIDWPYIRSYKKYLSNKFIN